MSNTLLSVLNEESSVRPNTEKNKPEKVLPALQKKQ